MNDITHQLIVLLCSIAVSSIIPLVVASLIYYQDNKLSKKYPQYSKKKLS